MKRNRTGWLFAAPWLLGFAAFTAYPFAASLYWSFCKYDLLSPPRFVGTVHYERLATELFAGDRFAQALWNTGYYAFLSVPLTILVGVGLSGLLSQQIRGRAIYRTIFFLPSVVPVVAASVLWMWLLDPGGGLVNYWLSLFGLPYSQWFSSVSEAATPPELFDFGSKDGLILMAVWGSGNFMVIYLAAIGDIPLALYEAAEIDGANRLRRFCSITIPMLSPVIFFNLVMGVIQSVQAFTQVYLVSEGTGEPAGASLMLSLHLFLTAFQDLEMGYTSALAWILFCLLVLITALLFRTARHWVHYQGATR